MVDTRMFPLFFKTVIKPRIVCHDVSIRGAHFDDGASKRRADHSFDVSQFLVSEQQAVPEGLMDLLTPGAPGTPGVPGTPGIPGAGGLLPSPLGGLIK